MTAKNFDETGWQDHLPVHWRVYLVAAILLLACVLDYAPARAATRTTTFQVTANVSVTCLISAAALNFGTYAVLANVDAQSSIPVGCTHGAAWEIALDKGLHGAGVTA